MHMHRCDIIERVREFEILAMNHKILRITEYISMKLAKIQPTIKGYMYNNKAFCYN